jgi:F0F1-type ATP synthase gamma subunit
MNFHSLIRVDKAKKRASKYNEVEKELTKNLAALVYNRNLKLDKKMLLENPNGEILNIYIGNDLGFCGNFNHQLQTAISQDKDAYKIIIGKKIKHVKDPNGKILLAFNKEEFNAEYQKINDIISDYIKDNKAKEINVVFNNYHSVSSITFDKIKLFPLEINESDLEGVNTNIDYVIETDVNELISSIIVLSICYRIKIFESNSHASENVMRERVTRDSLKKIEEMETEQIKEDRKQKKQKAFKKQISNYRILKG